MHKQTDLCHIYETNSLPGLRAWLLIATSLLCGAVSATPAPAQQLVELEQAISQQRAHNQFRQAQLAALQQEALSLGARQAALLDVRQQIEPSLLQQWQLAWRQLEQDMPFYWSARQTDWQGVRQRLLAPDVPLAQRATALLGQLQQEDDYGQQISRYHGGLSVVPDRQLAFVRVGRLAWCAQQLDAQQAWCWQAGQWQALPAVLVPALSPLVEAEEGADWLALSQLPLPGPVEEAAHE